MGKGFIVMLTELVLIKAYIEEFFYVCFFIPKFGLFETIIKSLDSFELATKHI